MPIRNVVLETEKTPEETFKLFNANTKRVQSSWSFKPVNVNNTIYDINTERVANDILSSLEAWKGSETKDGGDSASCVNGGGTQRQTNTNDQAIEVNAPQFKEYWSNSDIYFINVESPA